MTHAVLQKACVLVLWTMLWRLFNSVDHIHCMSNEYKCMKSTNMRLYAYLQFPILDFSISFYKHFCDSIQRFIAQPCSFHGGFYVNSFFMYCTCPEICCGHMLLFSFVSAARWCHFLTVALGVYLYIHLHIQPFMCQCVTNYHPQSVCVPHVCNMFFLACSRVLYVVLSTGSIFCWSADF